MCFDISVIINLILFVERINTILYYKNVQTLKLVIWEEFNTNDIGLII